MAGIDWNAMTQLLGNRQHGGPLGFPANGPSQPPVTLPALSVVLVDGRSGADAYPLPPNCPGVPLFDKGTGSLYIKSTDAYNNATIVEFEPPVVKQTEADKQKAMMVQMDERMGRLEAAIAQLINNGGAQNGNESNTGSAKSGKHSNGGRGSNQPNDNNT